MPSLIMSTVNNCSYIDVLVQIITLNIQDFIFVVVFKISSQSIGPDMQKKSA